MSVVIREVYNPKKDQKVKSPFEQTTEEDNSPSNLKAFRAEHPNAFRDGALFVNPLFHKKKDDN